MKKFCLTVLSLAVVSGSVFSQIKTSSKNLAPALKNGFAQRIDVNPSATSYSRTGHAVWEDDFSTPANWVISNEVGNTDDWVIGTNGPAGGFAIADIISTSGGNFALFDSDVFCSGNQIGNLTLAAPIDLSGVASTILEFEQYYRRFNDSTFVFVSIDNVNWVKYTVNESFSENDITPINPALVNVNITATAANEAQVWIRFQFWSPDTYTTAPNPGGPGCGYAWMIDDVTISPLPADDIDMLSAYISHNNTGEEYGRIPQNQTGQNMVIGCQARNFGANDQNNLNLTADFTGATPFSAAVSISMLAAAMDTLLEEVSTQGPLLAGEYTGTFTISSDNDTVGGATFANNTLVRKFEVTDSIYSTDGFGVYDNPIVNGLGTNSFADGEDGFMMLSYYDIGVELEVKGIQILLGNGTEAGGSITLSLHDSLEVLGTGDLTVTLDQTDLYDITQDDIDAGMVTLYFDDPVSLSPGGYFASCEMFSNAGASQIVILDDETVLQPSYLAMIYIADPVSQVFSNGTAAAIRMIVDFEPLGIADRKKLDGISIYPNPTEGIIRINMEVQDTYTIEVMNVLGEQVLFSTASSNTSIDLNKFGAGFYMVRVSSNEASVTQKVIVK